MQPCAVVSITPPRRPGAPQPRLTPPGGLAIYISSFGEMKNNNMRTFMNITKALADENRIRALLALRPGELCVCQITELFGLAPSTISKHLSILFQAGLVESRKEGRWIYYQLPGPSAPVEIREALDWVEKSLAGHAQVSADAKELKQILKQDPTELCKRQCQK
jgi:DNA-binding transcriptional ArsR family regulator